MFIFCTNDFDVCWNNVSQAHDHDISRHQVSSLNDLYVAIPQHFGLGRQRGCQCLNGFVLTSSHTYLPLSHIKRDTAHLSATHTLLKSQGWHGHGEFTAFDSSRKEMVAFRMRRNKMSAKSA